MPPPCDENDAENVPGSRDIHEHICSMINPQTYPERTDWGGASRGLKITG